jgi:hypothetical protein
MLGLISSLRRNVSYCSRLSNVQEFFYGALVVSIEEHFKNPQCSAHDTTTDRQYVKMAVEEVQTEAYLK